MKRRFISELAEGDVVDAAFVLRAKEMRAARTGEAYLTFELADRSGRIGAIMFRPGRDAAEVPVGSVARIRGTVSAYRGIPRVSVERVRPLTEYDPAEILPSGTREPKELLAEFRALVVSVKDPALRSVLRGVFGDKEFMRRFRTCPASQSHHHAYLGGLIEHTVSVATLCRGLSGLYPHVDADLLVCGALLHDVGKVEELEFTTGIEYTDDGRLIGHVLLGERRVRSVIDSLGDGFDHALANSLSHILLSHHGELEWGSPKKPSTLEALMLHHADNLDAKTAGFIAAAAGAGRIEEPWTDAGNLFRRPLWAPRAVEDDRPHRFTEDDEYALTA